MSMEASTLKTMRATAERLKARRDAGDELVLTGMEAHWIGVTELLVIEEVERLQRERDHAIAEAAALRAAAIKADGKAAEIAHHQLNAALGNPWGGR